MLRQMPEIAQGGALYHGGGAVGEPDRAGSRASSSVYWSLVHPGGGSFDAYVAKLVFPGLAARHGDSFSAADVGLADADAGLFLWEEIACRRSPTRATQSRSA